MSPQKPRSAPQGAAGARQPGHIAFACGHVLRVGYGPWRPSDEPCRNCLRAEGRFGQTEVVLDGMIRRGVSGSRR